MVSCRFLSAALAGLVVVSLPAYAALKVTFVNQNPDYDTSNIYVLFHASAFAASCSSGPVELTTCYSLDYFGTAGVTLSNATGGLCYLSLGKPLTSNSSEPSFYNWTDPDYTTRWDRFELTFNGSPYDVADLTGINSFAIPIELNTYKTNVARETRGYQVDAHTMISYLQATATTNTAVIYDDNTNFIRVIGPTSYPNGDVGPYVTFDGYVEQIRTGGISSLIVGQFSGPGGASNLTTQIYNFTATIDSATNLVMVGGSSTPGGVGTNHTIIVAGDDIAYHIYANNPAYLVDGASNSFANNDVYSAGVRDILSGFAIGYVGSTVTDPVTHVAFKNEASSNWYAATQPLAFSDVQSNKSNYNQYAEVFWRHSDSYGFPFSDRLHKSVQIGLAPAMADTLEVVILPDVVPEPSMLVSALLAAMLLRRMRRPVSTADGVHRGQRFSIPGSSGNAACGSF